MSNVNIEQPYHNDLFLLGYDNYDFIVHTPIIAPDTPIDFLTNPEVIRETLNYLMLSSDRVTQMTRTYHDIEAVTRLLEEVTKSYTK